ncbi:unnamed protein product (macronuclear) [Paramecium tetraurelia]|uniref:Uncharacterized protein n=1 Tax=Paramecium tetraurelia TaxID=5888 RepID=A0DLT7_PARTE|nr:uncharacterized protein GSPATT00039636001 [Paramecium tetraurelia]CAK84004.1 unnamed protein product [Paramecium tetraurelia]|eukprot:XP_001451401.1 hypothetical protein (macronuclear) [Paramecium tetraurelia strain d4-2]
MTSKILILIVIAVAASEQLKLQPCDTKLSTLKVFPSTGETLEWDLKDTFFEGAYLTYSLSPSQSLFQIQKPFAQLSSPKPHSETINRVTASRALTEKGQRVWMNHFVFIEVELDSIDLFYSEGAQGDNTNPPQFKQKISVSTGSSYLSCLGVDYLSKDKFILDCIDSQKLPFTNKFFVIDKNGNSKIHQNGNYNNYRVNTKRISQTIVFTNKLGHDHTFLFRSTPAYATQSTGLDVSSLLEVFYIDSEGTPRLQSVLDAPTLGVITEVSNPEKMSFSLIDFKVFPNGLVYILTARDGVYILEFLGNGEFGFIDRIVTSKDQAYEFDVDYLLQEDGTVKEVIAIMYNDYIQIVEGKVPVNTYILEFTAAYPATLVISQQFLIIQQKGVTYLFSTEHEDFIHKEVIEGAKGYIINPYETELISITQVDSRRYSLTHGLLRFPSTSTTTSSLQSFTLVATDSFSTQCKVTINFKVFNALDYTVQPTEELQLPSLLYDIPAPFNVDPLASGPNLNYLQLLSQKDATTVTAKIVQLQEMLLESISLPNPSSVIYSDVLVLDAKDERYALLLQSTNKTTTIYQCYIRDKFKARSECKQYQNFDVSTQLNMNNFIWWYQGFNIYHLVLDNDYSATIRVSGINGTSVVDSISYPAETLNKITAVTVLKDKFYFILGNKKQIDIRSTYSPFELEYSVTEVMLRYRGFTGSWNPQRIFGNRVHNSYLLFITNDDNVIVADYHAEFTIVKVITLSKGSIDVAVGLESFFIILKSATQNLIQEYDLQNLNSIHLMKTVPLYWYTIQTPLQTDFCSDTGVLFVRAYDSKSAQTVVLVYGPGKLLRDSLLKAIPLGSKIADGTSIMMSTAGSSQMVFYVNSGTLQKVYSYFDQPVLTIQPNYDQSTYFSVYTIKFQINNYNDITPITYYQVINLINTQITIRIEQNVLDYRPLNATQTEQNIDLVSDWFDGQAVSLDIDCDQCDSYVKPIQTVQQMDSGSFNGYHIIDAAPYKGQRTIYLANQQTLRVLIADSENKEETSYSISLSTTQSHSCDHIVATEDGVYIFATCQLNNQKVFHIAKCSTTGQLECHQFGTIQTIDGIFTVAQLAISGNYVFVLNSNPQRPRNYEGTLNVYKWTASSQQVTFDLQQIFDKAFFGNQSSYFSSFYIAPFKVGITNYLKVLIVDAKQNLYSVDASISTFGVITWQTKYTSLNLYTFINQGQFVSSSSSFYQVLELSAPVYSSTEQSLKLRVLVTTDTSAHYGILLTFDAKSVSTGLPLTYQNVIYLLNQYSTWTALNKATVGNDYAIIAYTDNSQLLLASYLLPKEPILGVPLIKLVGGTQSKYGYPQVNDFLAYIPKNIGFPRLYANIIRNVDINENLLQTYYLNPTYQLYVYNVGGDLNQQFVSLTLVNAFTQDTGLVLLRQFKAEEIEEEKSFLDNVLDVFW